MDGSQLSIRTKLLLLGLATLALPWAGCQYATGMESSLRAAEQQSLLAVARAIATSLQGRTDLLYDNRDTAAARTDDFETVPLTAEPAFDGLIDDWPGVKHAWRQFTGSNGDAMRVLCGVRDRYLLLLLDVTDSKLIFDSSDAAALDSTSLGDRIWLSFSPPGGGESEDAQYFVSTWSPGPVRARRIITQEFGRKVALDEQRINGFWLPTPRGYRIELRIPLAMIGDRFGLLLDDRDKRGAAPRSFGSLSSDDLRAHGRIIAAAPALSSYLAQFRQRGVRIVAATPAGMVLGEANSLPVGVDMGPVQSLLSRLYRRFLARSEEPQRITEGERGRLDTVQAREAAAGRADTALLATTDERRLVVAAATGIYSSDKRSVIGVLQVAQTADRWLVLRDQALTKLLNLTLLVTAAAMLCIFAFSAWLALRLSRLKRASESALSREGQLTTEFPDRDARDELGDVARSFSQLLDRLNEYTGYLRSLAGKLSHEIRTPLTIVRSSLENLENESVPESARVYVARARQGSERLHGILLAMGAATRVEEAIGTAERVRFDLGELLDSAVQSYRGAFPQRQFAVELPGAPCEMRGAPELLMQLLDKLIDNAVDFTTSGAVITLRLLPGFDDAVIEVENPGPPLPVEAEARLFESLWQSRKDGDDKPHFGLGLYIVRLIAEFHGGSASAANLENSGGVRFSIRLPNNF